MTQTLDTKQKSSIPDEHISTRKLSEFVDSRRIQDFQSLYGEYLEKMPIEQRFLALYLAGTLLADRFKKAICQKKEVEYKTIEHDAYMFSFISQDIGEKLESLHGNELMAIAACVTANTNKKMWNSFDQLCGIS